MKYIREFVGEFALAIISGHGKAAVVTKIVLWLLLILGGSFVPTDEVSFTIGNAKAPTFSMQIGHLISAAIGLVLVAGCLFLAWERSRRFVLRFADKIETTDEGKYWLTLLNDGNAGMIPRVFVVKIISVHSAESESILPVTGSALSRSVEIQPENYGSPNQEPGPISFAHPGLFRLFETEANGDHDYLCLGGSESVSGSRQWAMRWHLPLSGDFWVHVIAYDMELKVMADKWFRGRRNQSRSKRYCHFVAEIPPDVVAATPN